MCLIALIIIGIIFALLALILFLPLSLRLAYSDTLKLTFEAVCVSFPLYVQGDRKSGLKKRKRKKKKATQKKAAQKSESTITKSKKKPSPRSVLHYIKLAARILSRIYNRFPNCFTLRIRKFEVVIGGADAAKAAINYGLVSQAAAYVLSLIETLFRVKTERRSSLSISPNFLNADSALVLDVRLTTCLFSLLILTLRAWGVWRILAQETTKKQPKQPQEGV